MSVIIEPLLNINEYNLFTIFFAHSHCIFRDRKRGPATETMDAPLILLNNVFYKALRTLHGKTACF